MFRIHSKSLSSPSWSRAGWPFSPAVPAHRRGSNRRRGNAGNARKTEAFSHGNPWEISVQNPWNNGTIHKIHGNPMKSWWISMNPPNSLDGILTTGGFSILGKIMPVGYISSSVPSPIQRPVSSPSTQWKVWLDPFSSGKPRVQPTCRSWVGPLIVVAWLASIGFHDLYIDYKDFSLRIGALKYLLRYVAINFAR